MHSPNKLKKIASINTTEYNKIDQLKKCSAQKATHATQNIH